MRPFRRTLPLTLADSVTHLDATAADTVVVAASHGGTYAAACAIRWPVRGVILNDAGVGRDEAGVAGLALLDALGVPAAAVDHDSARIGDGQDTWSHGVISRVNDIAAARGCVVGMTVAGAAQRLVEAPPVTAHPGVLHEARTLIQDGPQPIWALDSASLAGPDDAAALLFTGSHGGLLGGRPATALKADARAAVFNDAGIGRDRAGVSRLPALDARGIPAATVDADSARIGDGRSTYHDGVLSAVNAHARELGARPGMTSQVFADIVLQAQTRN